MIKFNRIYNNGLNVIFDNVSVRNFQFKWSNTQPELSEIVRFTSG